MILKMAAASKETHVRLCILVVGMPLLNVDIALSAHFEHAKQAKNNAQAVL